MFTAAVADVICAITVSYCAIRHAYLCDESISQRAEENTGLRRRLVEMEEELGAKLGACFLRSGIECVVV